MRIKKSTSILLILFLGLNIITTPVSLHGQEFAPTLPEKVGLSSPRLDRIGNMIEEHVKNDELSGGVALVSRKGKIAYHKAFGWASIEENKSMETNTIFRIASMTKLITSVGVMILFEEDHFSLNDPVQNYIPEMERFRVAVPPGQKDDKNSETVPLDRPITIRDLLRHTSGLSYGFGFNHVDSLYSAAGEKLFSGDMNHFINHLTKLPLATQPGTMWEYSYSTDVLGRLIEIVSGQTLDKFLRDRIFVPLRMVDTDYVISDEKLGRFANRYRWDDKKLKLAGSAEDSFFRKKRAMYSGGGGLISTALDYSRFLQMLLNGGQLDSAFILSPTTVHHMTSDHLTGIDHHWLTQGHGFGLGAAVITHPSEDGELASPGTYYWAGIYNTFFFVDPKEEMIGILMTQMSPFVIHNLDVRFRKLCLTSIID